MAEGRRNVRKKKIKKEKHKRSERWLTQAALHLYYRLRKLAGLEEIAANRIRVQRLLEPGEDPLLTLRQEDEQRVRHALLCLAAGIFLTVMILLQNQQGMLTVLTRPGYGELARRIVLELSIDEQEYQIPVKLDSLTYTEEELELRFQEAWEAVEQTALGENPDWEHVSKNLDFREDTEVPGISVQWISMDVDQISADGVVRELDREEEPVRILLTAVLRYEEKEKQMEKEVCLIPPELALNEAMERKLEKILTGAASNREQEEILLPASIDGSDVQYRREETGTPIWLIPLLGVVAVFGLWILPEQRRREALDHRYRELALEYSELVWKLTVLLGAGLTVKGAWERILRGYREHKEKDGTRVVLYEEMQMAWNAMNQGTYEEKAYAEFGRRCGLQSYLRLGNLLEMNVRQGRKGLIQQMQAEAETAFGERLQLARRQGEEASSRLLMPMMVLFGLVLVILLVPAMLSLG